VVKKSIIYFSPVYTLAISAAICFFIFQSLALSLMQTLFISFFLVLSISFLHACVQRRSSYSICTFLLYIPLGILIGFLSSRSVVAQEKPLRSLGQFSNIVTLHGKCLSDPMKVGESNHTVNLLVTSCETNNGNVFSAKGTQRIYIDSAHIQHNQVGGIGWKNKSLITKGTIAQWTGRFTVDSLGKYVFYAHDMYIPPKKDENFSLSHVRAFFVCILIEHCLN
jgi:hypothetical protein